MRPAFLLVVIALSILLDGCASLPPFLERWAGLELEGLALERDDPKIVEAFYFFAESDRLVLVTYSKGGYIPGPAVAWRIRKEWLEIDTTHDGTFQKRMRPIGFGKGRIIVVESPTGKKSVYKYSRAVWYPG